jgi:RNA-directed DNA polymerase
MRREKFKWKPHKNESTEAEHRHRITRSSEEVTVMVMERRGYIVQWSLEVNQKWKELMSEVKSYNISKEVVLEAFKRVKANKGTSGVDKETTVEFDRDMKNNLYKIWNRMSSGSYFPPPVLGVEIPKGEGGKRKLGIPTVSDRIAQMVVKIYLEPKTEPYFHADSYAYRPKKSAIEAIGVARERCWKYDWVLDIDIKGFFDNIDHDLMMKALKKHTKSKWILLYIERWLKAPMQEEEGTLVKRRKGTPQGGVISPLLANLFLHYTFDKWMEKYFPNNLFERYADDIVVHCRTEEEAKNLMKVLKDRFAQCRLEINSEKTKIVYCRDDNRKSRYTNESFDFLGYTFRSRKSKSRYGKFFINFSPGVSNKSKKKMCQTIRGWKIQTQAGKTLEDLSRKYNPIIRGWINYYSKYYKSSLYLVLWRINLKLIRWAMQKYKRLRGHQRKAGYWLGGIARKEPNLFCHWMMGIIPAIEQ